MTKSGKQASRRRWPRRFAALGAVAVALLIAWMALEAMIVRLMIVDVPIRDLPPSFDGITVLFVSDIHANAFNSPERAAQLIHQLQVLQPDLLLLGGDYSNADPLVDRDEEWANRDRFFSLIDDFEAPLGKYGVAGNHDVLLDEATGASLQASMALGGVTLLRNSSAAIQRDGQSISLIGLDDWTEGVQDMRSAAAQALASNCTIVLSHTPDALPPLNNQPAPDGARWVDLMLSGHLHGGQITLFGVRPLIVPSVYGERFLSGWYLENGAKLLVSNGAGTMGAPLRLGAPAQVHLLALHRAGD